MICRRYLVRFVSVCAVLASACSRDDVARGSDPDSARVPSSSSVGSGDTAWTALPPGRETNGFTLAADGSLTWRGRTLTPPLRMRDAADSSALTYQVSPASPSGRWALAQGRGSTFAYVYVLDSERGAAVETPVTKYSLIPWIAWSPKLPYAIVSNHLEGTALIYRIDLTSGEARHIDFAGAVQAPLSATPIEATLRWLDADGSTFSIDARVACNDAVERCSGAPAAETRTFHVDVQTRTFHVDVQSMLVSPAT